MGQNIRACRGEKQQRLWVNAAFEQDGPLSAPVTGRAFPGLCIKTAYSCRVIPLHFYILAARAKCKMCSQVGACRNAAGAGPLGPVCPCFPRWSRWPAAAKRSCLHLGVSTLGQPEPRPCLLVLQRHLPACNRYCPSTPEPSYAQEAENRWW